MKRRSSKNTPILKKPLKRGRKSYWEARIQPRLLEIAAWCRDGYTDKQICETIGISVVTFCKYKQTEIELIKVLKVNKQIADLTVENSLYKRAVGFSYEEITNETRTNKDGEIISRHIKKIKKIVLPDTTAQIFWLKNRKQKEWKDRIDKTSFVEPVILNMNFGGKNGN